MSERTSLANKAPALLRALFYKPVQRGFARVNFARAG